MFPLFLIRTKLQSKFILQWNLNITRSSRVSYVLLFLEVCSRNTREINRAYGLIRLVVIFSSHVALRLVDVASPRTISMYKKKKSSGTQGISGVENFVVRIKIVKTTLQ